MSWENLKIDLEAVKQYNPQMDMQIRKIETDMFKTIYALLRVSNEDNNENEKEISSDIIKDSKENLNNNQKIKAINLSKMVGNVENYHLPELMLYIMSHAHNDWVSNNINKYNLEKDKNACRFVPFNMLDWSMIEKEYYSVLKPITDSIGIKYNKEDISKQFKRDQLTFLFENNIFSKEDLSNRMNGIIKIYKNVFLDLNEFDAEKYCTDNVINNLSEQVSKQIELNWAKSFKQIMMMDKEEIGIITANDIQQRKKVYKFSDNIGQKIIGFKKSAFPVINKPISKIMYNLAVTNGVIFAKNIKKHEYKYFDSKAIMNRPVQFKTFEDCTAEQKRQILKRNRKVKKFVDSIAQNSNNKGEESGLITLIPINKDKTTVYSLSKIDDNMKMNKNSEKIIQIRMTLKDLAQLEILPEEIGWEPHNKSLINSDNSRLLELEDKNNILKNGIEKDFIDRVKVNISTKNQNKTNSLNNEKEDRDL